MTRACNPRTQEGRREDQEFKVIVLGFYCCEKKPRLGHSYKEKVSARVGVWFPRFSLLDEERHGDMQEDALEKELRVLIHSQQEETGYQPGCSLSM